MGNPAGCVDILAALHLLRMRSNARNALKFNMDLALRTVRVAAFLKEPKVLCFVHLTDLRRPKWQQQGA